MIDRTFCSNVWAVGSSGGHYCSNFLETGYTLRSLEKSGGTSNMYRIRNDQVRLLFRTLAGRVLRTKLKKRIWFGS